MTNYDNAKNNQEHIKHEMQVRRVLAKMHIK